MLNDEVPDEESDPDDPVDDSDEDPDYVLPNDEGHSSTDSSSGDDENYLDDNIEADIPVNRENEPEFYFGKPNVKKNYPGFQWSSSEPNQNVRIPAHNIVRGGLPGLRGRARALGNKPDKLEVFELLFDHSMINTIVTNTNIKLASVKERLGPTTNSSTYRETDEIEMKALLGLLLFSSILKGNDEDMNSIFSADATSRPIYTATFTKKRYLTLLACLRFDEMATRDTRRVRDKAAPISGLFLKLVANSQDQYCVSSYLTVDEMLVPFRGRCPFKVFMPKKPKKYGVKIMCLTDAKTSYLYNAYIYTGKKSDGVGLSPEERKLLIPTQSVLRLCQPVIGTNKNITGDNWFSSVEVTDQLKQRGLTYVGTLKRNKREIPPEFQPGPTRPVGSALFGFNGEKTLVSFVPKPNKAVILISTMHHSKTMDEEKKKPEIICCYNQTKCGVDILDMKCAVYSSSRRTRRWPLAVFYRMLNIASTNSYILYMSYTGSPMITRFQFVKDLAMDLVTQHLRRRLEIPNLRRTVKTSIKTILYPADEALAREPGIPCDKMEKRKTCSKCPSARERKTQYRCIRCLQAICLECSRKVCTGCAPECV